MKIQQVIDAILAYHPFLENYNGCDEVKCGDTSLDCTGVVCAMSPTIHVIQKAVELGANLIVVHEPTNYTSMDRPGWHEDFDNSVFKAKMALLKAHSITIWRDHDHMHAHQPDSIFFGVLREMGWEAYARTENEIGGFTHFWVELPEAITLSELMKQLVEKIGMNGCRYIGEPDMPVQRLAIVGHLPPMMLEEKNADGSPKEYGVQLIRIMEAFADVVLPGEAIDWTLLSYIRDAVQLGKQKAMINLGHYNWEELGMRDMTKRVREFVGEQVKVSYVPSEDLYSFF